MKKLLVIIAISIIGNQLLAQLQNSHAFAVGSPDGVTIWWDAYSDQLEIEGCYLYKKATFIDPYELLTTEILVSLDSLFSYIDTGTFDPEYPPIYAIHIQTADSTYIIDKVFGFKDISFEVVSDNTVEMRLTGWNTTLCCSTAKLWLDGVFAGDYPYDNPFSYTFDLAGVGSPNFEVYLSFEDNSGLAAYAEFKTTGTYLFYILNAVGNPEFEANSVTFKLYPNPAITNVNLQLPENTPLTKAQIELYSSSGRLLHKAKPSSHFHKIDVAHLPKGLYLVRLWDGESWNVEKLVVR